MIKMLNPGKYNLDNESYWLIDYNISGVFQPYMKPGINKV